MKIVIYKFQVKLDSISDFARIMNTLIIESMKEKGCLSYELCPGKTEQDFTLVERWASSTALEAHKGSGHYRQLIPTLKTLMESSHVELLDAKQ